jgi:hypothetical protein
MDTKRNVCSFFNCLSYTLYLHFESLQTTTILLSSFFLNLKSFPLRILYYFTAFLKSDALQNVFPIINVGLFISLKSNGTLLVTSLRGCLALTSPLSDGDLNSSLSSLYSLLSLSPICSPTLCYPSFPLAPYSPAFIASSPSPPSFP